MDMVSSYTLMEYSIRVLLKMILFMEKALFFTPKIGQPM
jgi:hypothetical protein